MGAIEAYVDEFAAALRAPQRVKRDLVTEVHDSLVDAVEAYEDRGLARHEAEQQAVAEFGDVAELAPAYQAEIALAQGRRAALQVMGVVAAQPLIWDVWEMVDPARDAAPSAGYLVVDRMASWIGLAVMVGAALAFLATGVGARVFGAQRAVARCAGWFTLSAATVLVSSGVLLTILSASPSVAVVAWMLSFLALPMAWAVVTGRRCLAIS